MWWKDLCQIIEFHFSQQRLFLTLLAVILRATSRVSVTFRGGLSLSRKDSAGGVLIKLFS